MALELLLLFAGSAIVSLAIAYAWWSHVRVTFLREELFAIRDRLWDNARELDALQDRAYQQARNHLNAGIGIAGLYSIRTLRKWERSPIAQQIPLDRCQSSNTPLQEAIDAAYKESGARVVRYVVFYSASGFVALFSAMLGACIKRFGSTDSSRKVISSNEAATRFLRSPLPQQVFDMDRATQRYGAA